MSETEYDKLRRSATLVMQDRFRDILKEIAASGRVMHTDANEIDAICKIWNAMGLTWVEEKDS
jgi:hypothetical protein